MTPQLKNLTLGQGIGINPIYPVLTCILTALFCVLPACGSSDPENGDEAPVSGDGSAGPASAYNVLLISLDTLRADHLHVYGYERKVSPRIDDFAAKAVRFERAYSHAPWTAPAHASMLTSLYPTALGIERFPETGSIADRVETMAEFFKAHGYSTHAVTEGGYVHARFGFDQGFDYYFQSAKHVDHGVKEAIKWIDKHGQERFFFFFHTYDVHRYAPPDEYYRKFSRKASPRLATDPDLARKVQSFKNEEFVSSLTDDDLSFLIDLYDASIFWVDRHVGILLEYLDRKGLLSKTVVAVTSDHGEEFIERGRTGHGYSHYEEQISIPMIIHHPDIEPGVRKTMFRHIDLLPTLAEAVGLQSRPEWLGESLYLCLKNGDSAAGADKRFNFSECGHSPFKAIQSLRWKLIASDDAGKAWLYDLKGDPGELNEMQDENEDIVRQLGMLMGKINKANITLKSAFGGEGVKREDLPKELLDQLRELGYTK